METLVNTNTVAIQNMKSDIKKLVEEQKFLRNQRKTVHIVGERKIDAGQAWYYHMKNSGKLRAMYATYGILRGKTFHQIENHYPEENHPLNGYKYEIDKLIAKYNVSKTE